MGRLSRTTKQKELIRKEFEQFKTLFPAEELLAKVKQKGPSIGIATVYRFLKDLKSRNEVHSYLCERKMLYSKEDSSHCHFICQRCNKKEQFEVVALPFLKRKVNGKVCHFQMEVYGFCSSCLNRIADS